MIANFFNKSTPFGKLSIIILLSLVVITDVFSSEAINFNLIFFLKKIAILFFLLLNLYLIHFITKRNKLIKENIYDMLLIVIFIAMFPDTTNFSPILISHFILLLAFRRIYSLRTLKKPKEKLFDSSMYIGIATLIYPWSILYLVLPYTAVISFNKRTIRNVIIPLIGFICPIFIYGTYLFLTDNFKGINSLFTYNFSFLNYNFLQLLIPLALILGFIIWATSSTTFKVITTNNEIKNSWKLIITHLVISILIVIPSPIKNGAEFLFLFFPMAVIFTNYLQMVNEKWFKDVFLYLFMAVAIFRIYLQFYPIG